MIPLFQLRMQDGKVLMTFSGKELIKGEPDASSFPSGGLRATFEARGYTAWDCTSPAFVRQDAGRSYTLYSNSILLLYRRGTGSEDTACFVLWKLSMNRHLRLLRLFGNTTSKKVTPSVGAEQEYFLVDAEKYLTEKRPDLYRTYTYLEQCLRKDRSWMIITSEQSVRESHAFMKRCK